MQEILYIYPYDETYVQIVAEESILTEVYNYFTFTIPNAHFNPKVKAKIWDGKIRLFRKIDCTLYKGLVERVKVFCKERQYLCQIHEDCQLSGEKDDKIQSFNPPEFVQKLNLTVKPYDFQFKALFHAVTRDRLCFLSPTSSGKSLIIFLMLLYYLGQLGTDKKMILIVPTVNLVIQMIKEFKEYMPHFPVDKVFHMIYEGQSKNSKKPIYVSTWQSIYEMPKSYFEQFSCVIGDECHTLKAKCIKHIFESSVNARYKFGLTGTLDSKEINEIVITGLTGPVEKVVEVTELIERKIVSKPKINCVVLNYSPEVIKKTKSFGYHEEMEFIRTYQPRHEFIKKIVGKVKGNALVLAHTIDHLDTLAEMFKETGKKVYVIAGSGKNKTKVEDREEIRQILEKENDAILVATFATCSTGMSIKNIQHVFFADSNKAEIEIVQTIGRGLRLDGKGNVVTIWDISDRLSDDKRTNTLILHFLERIKIYKKTGYKFVISSINI